MKLSISYYDKFFKPTALLILINLFTFATFGQINIDKLFDVPWLPTGYTFGETTLELPQGEAGIFYFNKDSTYFYHNPETGIDEIMSYTINDDMIEMETFNKNEAIIYKIIYLTDNALIVKPYERDPDGVIIQSNMNKVIFKRIN